MAATNKWVVLERQNYATGTADQDYLVAFYADVPAGTANADGITRAGLYADATITSAWKSIPPADLTGMQAGQIVERVNRVTYAASTSSAVILADLDAKQADFQAFITAQSVARGDRYGTRRTAGGSLTNTKVS
jgi:hypothetical protein